MKSIFSNYFSFCKAILFFLLRKYISIRCREKWLKFHPIMIPTLEQNSPLHKRYLHFCFPVMVVSGAEVKRDWQFGANLCCSIGSFRQCTYTSGTWAQSVFRFLSPMFWLIDWQILGCPVVPQVILLTLYWLVNLTSF